MIVTGRLVDGLKHFRKRISTYGNEFERVVGMRLFPGTLNVQVPRAVAVHEALRLRGETIGEPDQDLLFESCIVAGQLCYRVRPFHLQTGLGGHGDHILEIVSAVALRPLLLGQEEDVMVTFPGRADE